MKTKTRKFILRTFILCALVFPGTKVFAQTSFQSQIAELQAMEASLTADIALTQTNIAQYQDMVSSLDALIAEALNNGGDVTTLQSQRQDALNTVSSLQTTLAQQQADLAAVQNKIVILTDAMNQNDKNWVLANNPPPQQQQNQQNQNQQRINVVPNPGNPNSMHVIFQSTGNAAQDEQVVLDWLYQYGLVDHH